MNGTQHTGIVSFIWGIADDVLRDIFPRGKYRDVILPMTVIRRLDCLLEKSKKEVLERHQWLIERNILEQRVVLQKASSFPFYNTSKFTLRTLLDQPSQIAENFRAYLEGFSENVQEIIRKFQFYNQLERLNETKTTYLLVQKFTDPKINLSTEDVLDKDDEIVLKGLSNLGMGYVFEELIRKFNEENNEEAGEHFTPREIIELMTHLLFLPVQDKLKGNYTIYDPACGSGGMLTEGEKYAKSLHPNPNSIFHLYGQEINPETYAICKADMLIKGKDAENIKYGSTLSEDGFGMESFHFMLSNPPYGKAWKNDQKVIMDGKDILDPRFKTGVPRVSDGQLLFSMNMLSKMKETEFGSRIAVVHNGSALFTGDAGGGESEIRKWIIENDYLEAIVALPKNMFYNTGITTYIWLMTNRKEEHRKGKVQLIDASSERFYTKMRKSLGQKSYQLNEQNINDIMDIYFAFKESEASKIFDNEDFGYHKITVERPLRYKVEATPERLAECLEDDKITYPETHLKSLFEHLGDTVYMDFNVFKKDFEKWFKGIKLSARDKKLLLEAFAERHEEAMPVLTKEGNPEPDSELRDTENIPLKEDIETYFLREVLPHVSDAWIDHSKTVRGYEISFTKYFYTYQALRNLTDIRRDIWALEQETDGLLKDILED